MAHIPRERRVGYSWLGFYPAKLLKEEYPAWCKKRGQDGAAKAKSD